MPTQKRIRSSTTRSGARRQGDEYQDLVALEVLVDWLGHSERYEWVKVEADDAGSLDDVVARKRDGTIVYRQSKFAVNPDDQWTWETLLKQATGTRGKKLSSLLQDWATSLQHLSKSVQSIDAALYSNRDAAYEIRQACREDDATLLDFARLPLMAHEEIAAQLGSEEHAQSGGGAMETVLQTWRFSRWVALAESRTSFLGVLSQQAIIRRMHPPD